MPSHRPCTTEDPIDYAALEARLKTLGHASRLHLLRQLREPKTLDEILLRPGADQAGLRRGRPVSRQTVEHHLKQLLRLGAVRVSDAATGLRGAKKYVLDHAGVYAIIEEIRRIASLHPVVPLDPARTAPGRPTVPPSLEEGPRLLLVHGARPGLAFPLRRGDLHGRRGWIIGRAAHAHVRLDYDPYVSSENSEIVPHEKGFQLIDLRSAKNGTFVNFQRVGLGAEVPLNNGAVLGVGGSLLVFQDG